MKTRRTALMLSALALVATACGGAQELEGGSGDGATDGATAGGATDGATAGGATDGATAGGATDGATAGGDATGDAAAGCEAGDQALEGATITIGSKDFDEQLILGNISKLLLEDAGVTVQDEINLGGTNPNREALLSGDINHYWEYTGTAWISFFAEPDPIQDRQEQYEAVRDRDASENGLCWLPPAPFNNTYGIAFRSEAADDLGNPVTIGDIGSVDPAQQTLCVESEFPGRNDGLPGMEETYGLEFTADNVHVLDTGIVYEATSRGEPCNFGEIFTTDGRIAALDLTVLEDSESFFPLYNVAPVFTEDVFSQYGQALQELYAPVAEALTQDAMTQLNARVSAEGERPGAVAQSFLEENGLLG